MTTGVAFWAILELSNSALTQRCFKSGYLAIAPGALPTSSFNVRHSEITVRALVNKPDFDCTGVGDTQAGVPTRTVNPTGGLPDGVYDSAITTYELCRYLPLCTGVVAAIERTPASVVLPECAETLRRHPTLVTPDGRVDRARVALIAKEFVGSGRLVTIVASNNVVETNAELALSVFTDSCVQCPVQSALVRWQRLVLKKEIYR